MHTRARTNPGRPALLLALLLLVACAQERAPIDRVQPYALDKAFFAGPDLASNLDNPEFWTQVTLVDVGFGAAQDGLFTSTYSQMLARARWEITEDLLIARLSYERVSNSDGKGAGRATNDGVIVAAFAIEKHFDVIRDYNPTTGEQLNVSVENDTDRPWHQRQYMRVDWSKNLNVDSYDFDTLSLLGIFGGVQYEPMAYYVEDPSSPDAPRFDLEHGYFDVTTKVFARPELVDLSMFDWGMASFPACYLENDFLSGSYPEGSCNPVELTVRTAFRRVEDHDFEPVEWDGYRFQAFGAFTQDRYGYAREYGMADALWHRFLNHFQIWERSHWYADPGTMTGPVACFTPETTPYGGDPHRDQEGALDQDGNAAPDGTEDECAAVGNGSRCDTFRQRCTLPFQQRQPIAIPWYVTEDSDWTYFDATALAVHNWDVAFRAAVRAAQYAECRRVEGQGKAGASPAPTCLDRFPVYFGQQDDNEDALALALEVDDCRNGRAYADLNQDEAACRGLADSIGEARGYSAGVVSLARMPEILVLCHSPVEATDPAACGGPRLPDGTTAVMCDKAKHSGDQALLEVCRGALTARKGDLRYHLVTLVEEPQTESPWGISMNASDPLTGEVVSMSANVWTEVNDHASRALVDQMRYAKGELKAGDVTEGQYVGEWARAAEAAAGGGVAPVLTRTELNRRLSEFTHGLAEDHEAEAQAFADAHPEAMHEALSLKQAARGIKTSAKAGSVMAPVYQARRQAARGTEMEAQLVTPAVQQLFGAQGLPLTDKVMDLISPLRGGTPELRRQVQLMKQNALGERGACILPAAEAPLAVAGLADLMEAKFGAFEPRSEDELAKMSQAQEDEWRGRMNARAERMRKYLADKLHMSVIVHEMGHCVGMRHNFVSSSDAFSYRPQYWQLRTRNGAVTQECTDLSTGGAGQEAGADCVGPRYFDPVTREEREGLIGMFQNNSAMEYPGEVTQDTLGLGAWDFAAARLFYGDAAAVFADPSYNAGTPRGAGELDKMDGFGGILGWQPRHGDDYIHYSQYQKHFDLIRPETCKAIPDPSLFKPARWDEATQGAWDPVFDGLIVSVDGQFSRCRQPEVDYVDWDRLHMPSLAEFDGWYWGGPSIDGEGRVRVPYGFATDTWVDLGNLAVYTHDNGADGYEIFNFLITQQEVLHVFDNYRRGRQTFSVRAAVDRALDRYNFKLRDGAKGLTLMKNIYRDYAAEIGYDFHTYWPDVAPEFFKDNIIASATAFDHFVRLAQRPQAGPHYVKEFDLHDVLRSVDSAQDTPGATRVTIPNGATGLFGNVNPAGRPVENRLASGMGEYDTEYTVNAGSYYGKMWASMLFTESVDNFISDTLPDFVDARYRATSLADLFPDGYRRFLAQALTGDEALKGPRVAADSEGTPLLDQDGFPKNGVGWTTWWSEEPSACFPAQGTTVCQHYGGTDEPYSPFAPRYTRVLDGQMGWEQQKFFIAWTLLYLPENAQQGWLDLLRIWEMGKDADPGLEQRIEFHNPGGKTYVARTFGKEVVFGKTVQKGIAARVLEYANQLLAQAYEVEDGPDLDRDGLPDWYLARENSANGQPLVRWDPEIALIEDGYVYPDGLEGCNAEDSSLCTCSANRACMELERYVEVPFFLRQALDAYGLVDPEAKGIY